MQSRVSSHPIEQSMFPSSGKPLCQTQLTGTRHPHSRHREMAKGSCTQQPPGLPAQQAAASEWLLWENLYCSVQFLCFYLLLGKWERNQLSQWMTGRFTTGLHLCFLRSKNNLLHLPLNSAQGVKYKYSGYIPTPQNGMVPLKWSASLTENHSSSDCNIKDSSCAIPILTHQHWLLCNFPKSQICNTSTYCHMTFTSIIA